MVVVGALSMVACSGNSIDAELIVSGSFTLTEDGESLDAPYGVAEVLESGTVSIIAGTGQVGCGSSSAPFPPPSGVYLNVQVPEAVPGTPDEQFFQIYVIEGDDLNATGSSGGSVIVNSVTDVEGGREMELVVGFGTEVEGKSYMATGVFTVVLCN